jgi:hypothetical protein
MRPSAATDLHRRCDLDDWTEVRRDTDDELLGYVRDGGDRWQALSVFGGTLGRRPTAESARRLVVAEGLASLARRWYHRSRVTGDWQVMLIQEAWPGGARCVVGFYSLPGIPTFEIGADDFAAGDELTLEPPAGYDEGQLPAIPR